LSRPDSSTVGLGDDLRGDFGGQGFGSDHLVHHRGAVAAAEPGQGQRADVRLPRPGWAEFRPERDQQKHHQARDALDREFQKLLRGRVNPVHVLVGEQRRLFPRKPFELIDQYFQRQLLLALRRHLGQRVPLTGWNVEQRCDQRHRHVEPVCAARQNGLELAEPGLRRIVARKARSALELLDDGVQRAGRVMGRALAEQADVRLVLKLLAKLAHQARLADPGLAGEQHDLAFAIPRLPPAAQEQRNLLLAANQRRQARGLARLEAPLRPAFARNPPGRKRLGKALEPLWAEVSKLECPAHQPARHLADHDTARLG
jgi:hypothetical protein